MTEGVIGYVCVILCYKSVPGLVNEPETRLMLAGEFRSEALACK